MEITSEINLLQQIEENNERFRQQKLRFIRKLIERRVITEKYAKLLREIKSETDGEYEGANFEKVKAAVVLRKLFAEEDIGSKRLTYVGSGFDWQFTVAIGGRIIELIDPKFADAKNIETLVTEIRAIDSDMTLTNIVKRDSPPVWEVSFQMDLGKGMEAIRLRLGGCSVIDYDSLVDSYKPEEPLGAVLEFGGPTKSFFLKGPVHPSVASGVTVGTLIANFDFDDHRTASYERRGVDVLTSGKYRLFCVRNKNLFFQWSRGQRSIPPNPYIR